MAEPQRDVGAPLVGARKEGPNEPQGRHEACPYVPPVGASNAGLRPNAVRPYRQVLETEQAWAASLRRATDRGDSLR